MRNKLLKRIFPLIALLLLAPWPVAYAYDTDIMASQDAVQIEIAEAAAKPTWTAFGRAIGGVSTPGDLFYIDMTDKSADSKVTLYLTNVPELINCYRFLALNVGVYAESGDDWERATGSDGKPIPDTIISMRNGQVSFILPGYARYKVTIDGGGFYCTNVNADDGSLSPRFHLGVE